MLSLLKICETLDLFSVFSPFTINRAAVLMIHRFCDWGKRDFIALPADTLDQCLRYLTFNGYRTISLSEYVNKLIAKEKLYKTVVVTVDDGYRDFIQFGYPIFAKYNIPVSVFITTDFINGKIEFWWDSIRRIVQETKVMAIQLEIRGKKVKYWLDTKSDKKVLLHRLVEYCKTLENEKKLELIQSLSIKCNVKRSLTNKHNSLSWDEIAQLKKQGVEFYPHTKTHPILIHCSDAELSREIYEPKKIISSRTGEPSNIFCYPNGRTGDFDNKTIDLLKQAGYVAAFTAEEGFNKVVDDIDLFRLNRYGFPFEFMRFKQIVSGLEAFKNIMRDFFR